MKMICRALCASVLASAALVASGCVNEPSTTNTANTNAANTNTSAPPTNATANTNTAGASVAKQAPVTLPVLDAMFAEENFAGELKSKVGLTDEQVTKLRAAAREGTAALREGEGEEHGGSTAEAASRAQEQIAGVVGAEKAVQLASFVRERWKTGGEAGGGAANDVAPSADASKPNSVPTDTRVVVNAPAYRMDVFENGKLVKSYKVGIGYPEFPLPTGLRKANTIIFNPTWTPPDEPWVESSNKVKVGQKVEAGSKLNPLGVLKIPIGSPSLIHGGKSPAKLGTFASHGCVGLTNALAQDFAMVLAQVGGAQVSKQQVAAYALKRNETKNVQLSKPVPVELRYETIIVEDGMLRIFRDVYDHGTNTEENLRAVLGEYGVTLEALSEAERAQALDAVKQMARDATGKASDGAGSERPDTSATNKAKPGKGAGGERVTRAVKGKKEITIQIAALAGKGYPAPVGGGFEKPKPMATAKPATNAANANTSAGDAKPDAAATPAPRKGAQR